MFLFVFIIPTYKHVANTCFCKSCWNHSAVHACIKNCLRLKYYKNCLKFDSVYLQSVRCECHKKMCCYVTVNVMAQQNVGGRLYFVFVLGLFVSPKNKLRANNLNHHANYSD